MASRRLLFVCLNLKSVSPNHWFNVVYGLITLTSYNLKNISQFVWKVLFAHFLRQDVNETQWAQTRHPGIGDVYRLYIISHTRCANSNGPICCNLIYSNSYCLFAKCMFEFKKIYIFINYLILRIIILIVSLN